MLRWLLALTCCLQANLAEYFPDVDIEQTWQAPLMQPWEPLRATHATITVSWTPGWNPWCSLTRYELQSRRPRHWPARFADLEYLQHREMDIEDPFWPPDGEWQDWAECFNGPGRTYTRHVEPLTGYAVQFRVRVCGTCGHDHADRCSPWSAPQVAHTVLSAAVDKINFQIRGTGKNAPDYTVIEVNRQTIYHRRDETGLVLAVFSRIDFSLQWLKTYDTHRDRDQAVLMSNDIKMYNQSHFVFVASTVAWEWHAPRTLVQTMEYCGAYHFGQWAHTFAEQPHYASPKSDLQRNASQDEFGHPYAFVGIPGIGTGMGWESLMHNTGHYLAEKLNTPKAIIRGVAYFDYVARIYRMQKMVAPKANFYRKSEPPPSESIHNPYPKSKSSWQANDMPIAEMKKAYVPYIGTLQNHITKLVEAHGEVPPYNYAFVLVTQAVDIKVDPRPRKFWTTELDRVWQGSSARYWPHNGTLIHPGVTEAERSCNEFIYFGHTTASPESCGPDFVDCCDRIDVEGFPATKCGIGVAPTLCVNADNRQEMPIIPDFTDVTTTTMPSQLGIPSSSFTTTRPPFPYPFRVIYWKS